MLQPTTYKPPGQSGTVRLGSLVQSAWAVWHSLPGQWAICHNLPGQSDTVRLGSLTESAGTVWLVSCSMSCGKCQSLPITSHESRLLPPPLPPPRPAPAPARPRPTSAPAAPSLAAVGHSCWSLVGRGEGGWLILQCTVYICKHSS